MKVKSFSDFKSDIITVDPIESNDIVIMKRLNSSGSGKNRKLNFLIGKNIFTDKDYV